MWAVSAFVPGLPVYAAADTRAKAERAIRTTLAAYLIAHPDAAPTSFLRVARVSGGSKVQLKSSSPDTARRGQKCHPCARNTLLPIS
jgi:hypothetical protein